MAPGRPGQVGNLCSNRSVGAGPPERVGAVACAPPLLCRPPGSGRLTCREEEAHRSRLGRGESGESGESGEISGRDHLNILLMPQAEHRSVLFSSAFSLPIICRLAEWPISLFVAVLQRETGPDDHHSQASQADRNELSTRNELRHSERELAQAWPDEEAPCRGVLVFLKSDLNKATK